MTTETTPTPVPFFGVQRIFAKGISLEIPAGPKLFLTGAAPSLNMAIQVINAQLAEGVYDVTLRATLTGSLEEKTAYLVEVEQTGVFDIRNVDAQGLADMLEIGAPSILSPYLRAQLADVLTRATLPTFFLPEINWHAMAAENRAKTLGAKADAQFEEVTA